LSSSFAPGFGSSVGEELFVVAVTLLALLKASPFDEVVEATEPPTVELMLTVMPGFEGFLLMITTSLSGAGPMTEPFEVETGGLLLVNAWATNDAEAGTVGEELEPGVEFDNTGILDDAEAFLRSPILITVFEGEGGVVGEFILGAWAAGMASLGRVVAVPPLKNGLPTKLATIGFDSSTSRSVSIGWTQLLDPEVDVELVEDEEVDVPDPVDELDEDMSAFRSNFLTFVSQILLLTSGSSSSSS
jgi:hypothetical protein